ncbi:MAG: hypothetical protein ACOYYU_02980 [Chloroflexota bacterium]
MANWKFTCAFAQNFGLPPSNLARDTNSGIARVVNRIAQLAGHPPVVVYAWPGIGNAYAAPGLPQYGDEEIFYDPLWFQNIMRMYGEPAVIGVLAHEIGHIVTGIQVPPIFPSWTDEMTADYFAGVTLARMRQPRNPVKLFIVQQLWMPGPRYPDGMTRAQIVELGYVNAGGKGWL